MNQRSLSSINGKVHYWVAGEGAECILFTHGATADHGLMQPQMDHFAASYRVINWDVPAHGLSRPYQGFTLQAAAQEIVHILDAEGIDRAHLVGQSMGGYISQVVALEHPGRVQTLAAVDSSPIQPSYYSAMDNWLLSITPPLLKMYPYRMLINTIAKQVSCTAEGQAYMLQTLMQYTKGEIAEIMGRVYTGLQVYKQDFVLPHPLLIVYGQADHSGKVIAYCRRWAARENRPLQVVPQAAHNANMDNPEAFNRILESFLAENR